MKSAEEGEEDEEEEEEEREVAAEPGVGKLRRSRKKRRSKKESAASSVTDYIKKDSHPSKALTPDTLTSGSTTPEPLDVKRDITGPRANQMEEELTIKLQKLADQVFDSSTGEEGQREENKQGNEDRDEDDGRLWRMEIDLDEGRTEDEEEEKEEIDEEMKNRLYKLVAQSRLTYLSSTDDIDNFGQSEGEAERGKDEDVEEENKEPMEENTDGLTYKLCQLEKEVRANQFSSTEDELDRVGVMDEEKKTGEEEELATKVCRLANEVDAAQFSSTEDELDRAGRSDEGEDEETLWKLQAAQLRDLSSLVRASRFSYSEDQLDRAGEKEVVDEGGIESCVWEKALEKSLERRESFYLDVKMSALMDEIEERKKASGDDQSTLNILDGQTKDKTEENEGCMKERVTEEKEDERMKKGERQEMELKTVVEAERAEEIIHEAKVQQPEAKCPDRNDGEERQEEEKMSESRESQEKCETDSDEEEFDRIISSMLMMTLEDMQGETLSSEAPENRRTEVETENVNTGRESGLEDSVVGARSTNASEETRSAKELQSRGGDVTPESAAKEGPGEYVTEQSGGDVSRREESEDATDGYKNEQQEKDPQEKMYLEKENHLVMTAEEPDEARRKQTEVDDDEQEDRRGKTETTETKGEAAEGGRERKQTDEETKDDAEQSGTSFTQQGSLSPEEIQTGRDMELYKTVQFISTLLEQVSLRSITTEVLKVLNATEDLLQGVEGADDCRVSTASLPPNTDTKKLDQQFSRLEENVYMAAGAVYGLEADLSDLEECARGISSTTSDMELSFLEEQVASAAAKVQQSELQISDISARIAALKNAGLDVDTQSRSTKSRTVPVMVLCTLIYSLTTRRLCQTPCTRIKIKLIVYLLAACYPGLITTAEEAITCTAGQRRPANHQTRTFVVPPTQQCLDPVTLQPTGES
ncbi:Rab effector MyRIP [Larimichthys crocea]|uniref:Uncharacterized protein n=1 Tax=Larimichthys crocea TaxID=215358 RepID=A0ACD3QSF6_LARCR|nr:Rab effector MyRIP [Larimichthys crocea]